MKSGRIRRLLGLLGLSLLLPLTESCANKVYLGKDAKGRELYAYTCKGAPCEVYEGEYLQWGPKSGTHSSCSSPEFPRGGDR